MEERVLQIIRCTDELEKARLDRARCPGNPDVVLGCMISEMDWLEELHYRLYR